MNIKLIDIPKRPAKLGKYTELHDAVAAMLKNTVNDNKAIELTIPPDTSARSFMAAIKAGQNSRGILVEMAHVSTTSIAVWRRPKK